MAKKKTKMKSYLPLAAAIFGVLALIMLFLPAIVVGDESYNGLKVVFGYTEKAEVFGSTIETKILKFSFMNLLPYLLVIGGIVLNVLNRKNGSKLFALIATACFIVATVFFFCTIGSTVLAGDMNDKIVEAIKDEWKLGVGSILAAICSILAGLASITPVVMKK